MTSQYRKPLPKNGLNPELTKPFWDGAKRHELLVPQCSNCGQHFFYAREVCPNCLSPKWEWTKASGRGRLYSWTTVYQPGNPAFAGDAPYVYALIQLEEGPRIVGNLIGVMADEILAPASVNTPVEAVFEDVTPEVTLIKWRPTGAPSR